MIEVLVDCDGVLANYTRSLLDAINRDRGTSYSDDDIDQFDIAKALKLGPEIWAYAQAPGFCAALAPMPGAREALDRMRQFAKVVCVTAPTDSDTWQRERDIWLRQHMGFDRKLIIQAHDKVSCHGDVLIDDRADTIEAWQAKYGPMCGAKALLYRQPWNKTMWTDEAHEAQVVVNLADAAEVVRRIDEGGCLCLECRRG
jgi:5'(3')-deoxyribonucleotidase